MKLYLSSYKFGDNPEMLAGLIGENKRIGIIANSRDWSTDLERKVASLVRESEGLKQLGLIPEELDLRSYFGKPKELENKLAELGAVWVLGGNTFVLRRAYKESGMDEWILKNKNNKNFVYAGYSAGVCVLSPSLKGLETVDEPNAQADGYKPEIVWEGVGIIDFCFAPHYMSDHPESEAVNKLVEYYEKNNVEYKALHDGEVIVMNAVNC